MVDLMPEEREWLVLLRAECEAKPGHRGRIGFRNL